MSPRFDSAQAVSISPQKSRASHSPVLKVVEAPPSHCEEIHLPSDDLTSATEPHSLHTTLPCPDSSNPDLASYLIKRFSRPGTVVLDPFCGSGTTGLAANLLGRIAYQSDLNPVASCISEAKVAPADLAEVTLALQGLQLRRPVEMGPFAEVFQHFMMQRPFER